jgi:hypothetical protein
MKTNQSEALIATIAAFESESFIRRGLLLARMGHFQ